MSIMLSINVIKASLKITKSFVNQMPVATNEVLEKGKVLGHLLNIVKDSPKAILLELDGEYYVIRCHYRKFPECFSYRVGKRVYKRNFYSEEECDKYWKYYQNILAEDTKHIYI